MTLLAVSEKRAERATMVELDSNVASVWEAVLNGQSEWLAKRIETFKITKGNVKDEIGRSSRSARQRAWLTLLRNRVSYGGLMTSSSGLLKEGEGGKGLRSRWYPETLASRIRAINKLKQRISFASADGIAQLEDWLAEGDSDTVAYFIDPPYLMAGKRLYEKNELDHRRLFTVASKLKGRVLMTYDDTSEVRALAKEFGFAIRSLRMLSRQHRSKTELLISKDFSWLKNSKHERPARRKQK